MTGYMLSLTCKITSMGIAIALLLEPSIVAIIKMMILPSKPKTAFTNSMVEAFYALRRVWCA